MSDEVGDTNYLICQMVEIDLESESKVKTHCLTKGRIDSTESLPAVSNYTDELRDILSDGLVVHVTEKFETVRKMVFHGNLDE